MDELLKQMEEVSTVLTHPDVKHQPTKELGELIDRWVKLLPKIISSEVEANSEESLGAIRMAVTSARAFHPEV